MASPTTCADGCSALLSRPSPTNPPISTALRSKTALTKFVTLLINFSLPSLLLSGTTHKPSGSFVISLDLTCIEYEVTDSLCPVWCRDGHSWSCRGRGAGMVERGSLDIWEFVGTLWLSYSFRIREADSQYRVMDEAETSICQCCRQRQQLHRRA